MEIPAELKFSKDHEWALATDLVVRVGITDFAQDALGDVVFVELPKIGTSVSANDSLGEVESTKSVSEIYAPVSGTVTAINDQLSKSPELINSDPYGKGWICEITVSSAGEFENLLDAGAYAALISK
jgi:glycine cleavage system H protein